MYRRILAIAMFTFSLLWVSCSRETTLKTPLEKNDFGKLTSHSDLVAFLQSLDRRSELITMDTLGYSVDGRMIPYLKISAGTFGEDRLGRLMVMLFAQQHGDEPSGTEALLALARDIATNKHGELLQHLDILIVPQVNPDGAERHQRRNAEDIDLNRSHLILNAPEVIALRELFHRWEPYVTVDIHEYQPWTRSWLERGFIRLFDEQYGLVTNLNTDETIRLFLDQEFLPYAEREITAAGYTFHNYLVGSPDRIRYSTTSINDGRQGFGILNTMSLILEGKNERTPTENIKRRTEAQQHAIETLLRFCAERKVDILSIVRSARRSLVTGEQSQFVLTMGREKDSSVLRIPVLAVERVNDEYVVGDTIIAEIENYYPLVVKKHTTTIPDAYLVPSTEDKLISLLEKHRVLMKALDEGDIFQGEYYVLTQFTTMELEETQIIFPELRRETAVYFAREGDMLVPTDQLRRLLIATALEPQSMHGILQYDEFAHLRQIGRYPIMRVELPDIAEFLR